MWFNLNWVEPWERQDHLKKTEPTLLPDNRKRMRRRLSPRVAVLNDRPSHFTSYTLGKLASTTASLDAHLLTPLLKTVGFVVPLAKTDCTVSLRFFS